MLIQTRYVFFQLRLEHQLQIYVVNTILATLSFTNDALNLVAWTHRSWLDSTSLKKQKLKKMGAEDRFMDKIIQDATEKL